MMSNKENKMPSFKSKIVNCLLRNRHLFRGQLKRDVFDMSSSIDKFREQCENGANKMMKIPDGVSVIEENIAGIKSEWLKPKSAPENKLILYVHGGGYVSGSCNDHRSFVSKFADACNLTTLQYEYRLAPELPFPAALEDSISIYKEILKSYNAQNIIFAGESAGGGLLLAMLLAAKNENLPMPKAAVAISPWTDLTCSSESYKTKGKVSLAPKDSWLVFSKHYAGEEIPKNPLISPLFGNLADLPPLYINAGDADELFDDSRKFYEKAKAAGVDVQFKHGEGMVHCYPLMAPFFPEATEAMDEIVEFIKQHI